MPNGTDTVNVRAFAYRAVDPHGAAVLLHQFLHQRQADAGAFEGAALLTLDAVEPLEQPRQFALRNADAGIADHQLRRTFVVGDVSDPDGNASLQGEFECI